MIEIHGSEVMLACGIDSTDSQFSTWSENRTKRQCF